MDSPSNDNTSSVAASTTTIDEHLALTIQTLDQLTSIFNFPHHIAKSAIDECGPEDVTVCYNWILDNHNIEDSGGPVVPKADCPHVERHVKFRVKTALVADDDEGGDVWAVDRMELIADGNEEGTNQLSSDFRKLCVEGKLMMCDCQFDGGAILRRRESRKRLRSDDEAAGRLKCEEDYEYNNNDKERGSSTKPACAPGENWLCLECGALHCSRYAKGHAKLHYEDTKEEGKALTEIHSISQSHAHNMDTSGETAKGEGHCIAASLADLSVWCYECNAYLVHPRLEVLTRHLEEIKFGSEKKGGDDDEAKIRNDVVPEKEMMGGHNGFVGEEGTTKDEMDTEGGDTVGELKPSLLVDQQAWVEKRGSVRSQFNARMNDIMEVGKSSSVMVTCIDASAAGSVGKRKGTPRKLPSEQQGTTMPSQGDDGAKENDDSSDEEIDSLGDSDTSSAEKKEDSESRDSDQNASSDDEGAEEHHNQSTDDRRNSAAVIASLMANGQHDALHAYLARFEAFDTGDMGGCVPLHTPPPSFPDEVADFLRSPLCKSIIVLAGAGMSVSSGIPDFRSAGVGLYHTLRPELLTATEVERALIEDDPTLALDKGLFLQNPLPMLETKRSFILGTHEKRWKATLAHRFVELLHTKLGKLTRLYTQNIDGLELQTALPKEKVVNVHGSMGAAACEICGHDVDFDEFCNGVRSNIKDITGQDADAPSQSTPIQCEACGKLTVKPTIVLFRGSMPEEFHIRSAQDLPECDLLIIMGTSLTVAPANSLVYRIPPTTLRMVMNNERVGRRLGIDYSEHSMRDVFAHGHSDETCLELAEKMGWLDDLALFVDELPDSSARLLRDRLAHQARPTRVDAV